MADRVTVTITDHVADVRMVRTDKRNALDNAMFAALAEAGERLKTEPGVRAVVLSGEGSSFCAGLDFSSFQSMAGGERASARSIRAFIMRGFEAAPAPSGRNHGSRPARQDRDRHRR
jgi:enoyl-CoA hydratase/carnithine racemase